MCLKMGVLGQYYSTVTEKSAKKLVHFYSKRLAELCFSGIGIEKDLWLT